MLRTTLAIVFAVVLPGLSAQPPVISSAEPARPHWIYFDGPLWDISNEGLLFRLTHGLPGRHDALSGLLHATEARWMVSIGYARVYNSYDPASGVFKNPGGHAALISAGRQFRWHPPKIAGVFTPKIAIELGVHCATRPFPADGTRANILFISGLEWNWLPRRGGPEWSLAVIWPHFSNANLFPRNAGYDGLSLRLGRSIR